MSCFWALKHPPIMGLTDIADLKTTDAETSATARFVSCFFVWGSACALKVKRQKVANFPRAEPNPLGMEQFYIEPKNFRSASWKKHFLLYVNKSKHTRGSNERYLIRTRQNKVQIFGKCLFPWTLVVISVLDIFFLWCVFPIVLSISKKIDRQRKVKWLPKSIN